jgi:hypothetical protein
MKINLKKVISIMILIIAFEVVYLIGFYMPNKVAYGNSEEEIATENLISEDEMEIEIEDLISENEIAENDLTNNEDCDIIIADDESDVNDEDVVEIKDSEPTLEDILIDECPFYVIDEIYEIDSYVEGNWYCYYIYADGDVYVVTTKNGHVDICVQLN